MVIPPKTRRIRDPLPSLIDDTAMTDPTRVWASIPKDSNDLSKGYRDIVFPELSRAVNRFCGILEPQIGRNESQSTSVVCYLGLADPRCHIITVALQKLGHAVLLSAPRNSLPMHQHLFDHTDCHTLVHDKGIDTSAVVGDRPMKVIQAPSLEDILDGPGKPEPRHFPYTRTWEDIRISPLAVLHTSGSTGMPTPIYITHDYLASFAEQQYIPPYMGLPGSWAEYCRIPGLRVYLTFPPFHIGGLVIGGFCASIYGPTVMVVGPAHLPPLGSTVMQVLKYANVSRLSAIPAALMKIVKMEGGLEELGKLDSVFFAGGAIDKATGDAIVKVTHIQTVLGSTECCVPGYQLIDYNPDTWNYFYFAPDQGGLRFEERDEGVYEMVFTRDAESEDLHTVWKTFSQYSEYKTKDLFRRHPDPKYPHHMKFEGRTDDLIAFANASKYNPLAYEEYMVSNPIVRSALMAGTMRPRAALLVELNVPVPANEPKAYEELIERIWPTVQAANLDAPKHAFVRRDMILLATAAKPFERATKGTVVRARTLQLYASELDALYEAAVDSAAATAVITEAS